MKNIFVTLLIITVVVVLFGPFILKIIDNCIHPIMWWLNKIGYKGLIG